MKFIHITIPSGTKTYRNKGNILLSDDLICYLNFNNVSAHKSTTFLDCDWVIVESTNGDVSQTLWLIELGFGNLPESVNVRLAVC